MVEGHIEKLNIVMSYPVEWSCFTVMENFIQNFFDAIGPEDFGTVFKYEYDKGSETLKMYSDKGFDIRYLCGIGLSTKRAPSVRSAGKFGEGFKIAALCAYRDLGYRITMQSLNWRLSVCETTGCIDTVEVNFLAYDICELDEDVPTVLTLEHVPKNDYDFFLYELNNFYFVGNERFGKKIYEDDKYAVYYPADRKSKTGELYISYQYRRRNEFPLMLCNHQYNIVRDDRSRRSLAVVDFKRSVLDIIENVPDEVAYEMLEVFKPCWNGLRKGTRVMDEIDKMAIESFVGNLVVRVSKKKVLRDRFFKKYGETIVCNMDSGLHPNDRKIAMAWYMKSEYRNTRRRVWRYFELLDIDDIYTLCKKNDGLTIKYHPDLMQERCISVLNRCGEELMSDLYCYNELPNCSIIKSYASPQSGEAVTYKLKGGEKNSYGLTVRSDIHEISLKEELFKKGGFPYAFVVYMHELLHQFGGDSSIQFRKALLTMNEIIIRSRDVLDQYRDEWEALFGNQGL